MELRVLQYFLAVAQEQSISAAAEALHLSQPTLSTQLRALEEELGKQLLIRASRGSRRVTLTEEGMLLRKRAEEILALVRRAEQEVSLPDQAVAGDLCVGAGETQSVRLLARASRRLRARYPGVRVHIRSGNAIYVMEQMERGLLDFGLVYGPVDAARYHALRLPWPDVWGVLMRRDCPLAAQEAVRPEDLWEMPLILTEQESGHWSLRTWFERDFERLDIVSTYNLVFNASLMVEEGLGCAVAFDGLVDTGADRPLCFRPLSPRQEITPSLVWRKSAFPSRASERFLDCVREIVLEETAAPSRA